MDQHLALHISLPGSRHDTFSGDIQREKDETAQAVPAESTGHGDDKFLRIGEVLRKFPVSRSSWYAGIKKGIYPEGMKLAPRTVRWRESVINALVASL